MLCGGTPRELLAAVAAGDTARLQAVPGIGKRTAERIVVELREKVGAAPADADRDRPRRRPAAAGARRPGRPRLRARQEADELLDGAAGDTPEDLIAHAL